MHETLMAERKAGRVSIRTRPFGRVMPIGNTQLAALAVVSIRTRPFGRVMLAFRPIVQVPVVVSIRTRPFGRVMRAFGCRARRAGMRFNPHPAFRPGDAGLGRHSWVSVDVSIRTRPFGRVMPGDADAGAVGDSGFNPHPAFRPGDATILRADDEPVCRFNPHPAFRPGDARAPLSHTGQRRVFQSAPGLSAG